MTEYAELIARLEAAEVGPDLDASICVLLQYGGPNSDGATNVRTDGDWEGDLLFEQGSDECCNPIPAVTTSLDAALALAERVFGEEEAVWMLREVLADFTGPIKLLPVALCISILKALEAKQ